MEDYGDDGETTYIKMGWDHNILNCNIDESRSIMISDDQFRYEYDVLRAGIIIGQLGINELVFNLCSCGKWHWLEFFDSVDAIAFKLKW